MGGFFTSICGEFCRSNSVLKVPGVHLLPKLTQAEVLIFRRTFVLWSCFYCRWALNQMLISIIMASDDYESKIMGIENNFVHFHPYVKAQTHALFTVAGAKAIKRELVNLVTRLYLKEVNISVGETVEGLWLLGLTDALVRPHLPVNLCSTPPSHFNLFIYFHNLVIN